MKKLLAVIFSVMMIVTDAYAGAEDYVIVAPNGAPAIAVAGVWAENEDSVKTINADTIAEAFGSNQADFIIAPINAGAKLFKAGKSTYRLAAVITWGNLVFASKTEGFTAEMINGSKLVLFGENTINTSIALYVLQQKGIVPESVEYLAGAAETQALLLNGEEGTIVMTAEPAVTAAKMKDDSIVSIPLNDMYKEVNGFDGFAQAGLFVREDTLTENPVLVSEALETIRSSVEMCEKDPETVARNVVAMEILPKEPVALKALPGCNIRWMNAADARDQIEMTASIDLKQYGGELPADDFYFSAE